MTIVDAQVIIIRWAITDDECFMESVIAKIAEVTLNIFCCSKRLKDKTQCRNCHEEVLHNYQSNKN